MGPPLEIFQLVRCQTFSLYDARPSENDLIEHIDFIREAVKRDITLAKSKFLAAVLENPRKRKLLDEVVGIATKPSFIIDNTNGDLRDDDFITKETEDIESKSDDEADHFDTICSICDNGGHLIWLCGDAEVVGFESWFYTESSKSCLIPVTYGLPRADLQRPAEDNPKLEKCKRKPV